MTVAEELFLPEPVPRDVLKRNFWYCTIDDPSTIDTRHRIGVENIMVEVDYPGACSAREPPGNLARVSDSTPLSTGGAW